MDRFSVEFGPPDNIQTRLLMEVYVNGEQFGGEEYRLDVDEFLRAITASEPGVEFLVGCCGIDFHFEKVYSIVTPSHWQLEECNIAWSDVRRAVEQIISVIETSESKHYHARLNTFRDILDALPEN